ncbi:MAG: hypothetical protein VB875_16670, partial [Pirellulales bacterium]
ILKSGIDRFGDDHWRPFFCVGLAYFVIAVMVPVTMLKTYGENGKWTSSGVFWSLLAGAAGAFGALGVILAFGAKGKPVFVMPLIFGGAPVVNAFLTVYMSKAFKRINPIFLAGLVMVLLGAVSVLVFRPGPSGGSEGPTWGDWPWVLASVALVIVCWGVYGPVLHKGQMKMSGSRLRPLICVGLAYFVVAVIAPLIPLGWSGLITDVSWNGVWWSLGAGGAGAIGALGVIMAFNFGGKPVFVMPLIFGGAPVVNTFVTLFKSDQLEDPHPLFYAGLILTAAGAAIVLVFAPKGKAGQAPAMREPEQARQGPTASEDSTPAKSEAENSS